MAPAAFFQNAGGIRWYCEQRGDGPYIVLMPSGEGDCGSFETVATILSEKFTVLTFDTPGFSRTSAPPDPAEITANCLAGQISELVASLKIEKATFYGCSSGGVAVLDLLLDYPEIVRNAIIHEAAIVLEGQPSAKSFIGELTSLTDTEVVESCKQLFVSLFNERPDKWEALGRNYHARLERNYVTWVRHYLSVAKRRKYDASKLKNCPLAWTIGGLSPAASFFNNAQLAWQADIQIGLLMCKHFPQVSVPKLLADHIRDKTTPYLS